MPGFNVKGDFINAFKYIIVSIIYLIVLFLIFTALSYVMGITNYNFDLATLSFTPITVFDSDTSVVSTAVPTFEVMSVLIVSFILFFVFGLFEIMGICRLAKYDSLKEAINFKIVFNEFRQLKWRLLGGIILLFLISLILECILFI